MKNTQKYTLLIFTVLNCMSHIYLAPMDQHQNIILARYLSNGQPDPSWVPGEGTLQTPAAARENRYKISPAVVVKLVRAIFTRNHDEIRRHATADALMGVDQYGNTALHWAAATTDDPTIFDILITSRKDLNERNRAGMTPLALAINHGNINVINDLIARRADVSIINADMLHDAAFRPVRRMRTLMQIPQARAFIDIRDAMGKTPMMSAVVADNPDVVELLLGLRADINAADNHGETALHIVIEFMRTLNNAQMLLDIILSYGPDLNRRNRRGETPLIVAARMNNQAAYDRLITAGADATIRDYSGRTAADIMRERQADQEARGQRFVAIARYDNSQAAINHLVNIVDHQGQQALLNRVIQANNLEIINSLLAVAR